MEYLDDVLRGLVDRADYHPAGWSTEAVAAYLRFVQCAEAAVDDRDLHAMRSLRIRKREADPSGSWSISLDPGRQLTLRFKHEGAATTAILELLNSKADQR